MSSAGSLIGEGRNYQQAVNPTKTPCSKRGSEMPTAPAMLTLNGETNVESSLKSAMFLSMAAS
jgi:hypothetical protein